jgi:rhamnogalacturonyl hydrolase YesR
MEYLPEDHKEKAFYEQTFIEMATKIAHLQGNDGLWRSSLLDFEDFPAPETSATGFFCYGIAWGINNGYLEKEKYLPVVKKAWAGLNRYMNDEGKLGYVQLIGHDPRNVTEDDTMEYGTGAYLLAGSEILKLIK